MHFDVYSGRGNLQQLSVVTNSVNWNRFSIMGIEEANSVQTQFGWKLIWVGLNKISNIIFSNTIQSILENLAGKVFMKLKESYFDY